MTATRAGKVTAKKKTAAKTARSRVAKPRATRPTLATIAAQLAALTEEVSMLRELFQATLTAPLKPKPKAPRRAPTSAKKSNGHTAPALDEETFDADLLAVLGNLDRRARHSGMVPIPDVRDVFLERGWARARFDERLLRAERDFVVDLKAANDPKRLDEPDLAIQQPGRGHLQYVVAR